MKKLILLAFLFLSGKIIAQVNTEQSRQIFEDAAENAADDINESSQNEIPEEVMSLINHPLNLNSDDPEILVRFNLLSQQQLLSLRDYIKKSGKLVEMEELQQVDGFDKKTITTILPFCTVKNKKIESRFQQFTFRIQKSLDKQNENYPGSNQKILVKYKIVLPSSISFSFTGENDAGEQSFMHSKPGFDFNSFNICYKGKSLIRKIIIGDYNIEFGQGLTAWTGLSYVSTTSITGIYKYGSGIVPYTGTDENRFLRGVAVSLQKNNFRNETWYSHHAIDGNLVEDTATKEEYITTLQTSGYHRTASEIADFHAQTETAYGTSLTFSSGNISTGITIAVQHYDIPIINGGQPYNRFDMTGKDNYNSGWNFSYTYKNILLYGENSYCGNNAFAFLNGVLFSVDPRLSLGILWRSYAKDYLAKKSNAYGVNTYNTNETGNYFGINYKLTASLIYSGYIDTYSFPFLKYRVDQPSHGFDFFQQLEYTPSKKFTAQVRYRKKLKQLNDGSEIQGLNQLSDFYLYSYRFSVKYKVDATWDYNIRLELSVEDKNTMSAGKGTMLSQDLFFHPQGKPISINFRYSIFNCPDFDTRIYEYENDVQGAFSIPFYYGIGSRFYTNLNYKINRHIDLSLRYSISWTDDNISTSETSEIKLQLKTIFR